MIQFSITHLPSDFVVEKSSCEKFAFRMFRNAFSHKKYPQGRNSCFRSLPNLWTKRGNACLW